MDSDSIELLQELESVYFGSEYRFEELLSLHGKQSYRQYLPVFVEGLNLSSIELVEFCLFILREINEIQDQRICSEIPYLDEYDLDDWLYDSWLRQRREEWAQTDTWICEFMDSSSTLEKLQSLCSSSDNEFVEEVLRTITTLANDGYLSLVGCHNFIFSKIAEDNQSIEELYYYALRDLVFPKIEQIEIERFGDVLMRDLQLIWKNQKHTNLLSVLEQLIFETYDVRVYLWKKDEYVNDLLKLIDQNGHLHSKLHYLKKSRYDAKEKIDSYVLEKLIENGSIQNEFATVVLSEYVKGNYIDYKVLTSDVKLFLANVLFTWDDEYSDLVWKWGLSGTSIDIEILNKYEFDDLSESLKVKYLELLLNTNGGAEKLITIYQKGQFDLGRSVDEMLSDPPFYEENLIIGSIKNDSSDNVLDFVISVAKNASGDWTSSFRNKCREYLINHPSDRASQALNDDSIKWEEIDESWFDGILLF